MSKLMEILSPAGNYEQGIAAIRAGANAVYGGLKKWNARTRATNFTLEEYTTFIKLCHSNNVKFYLTINSLLTDNEIDEIINVLSHEDFILPDAIIITDIGLITKIKKKRIAVPLHISTQQGVSNVEEALFFQNLGAERVVLARELSLDTIKKIKEYTSIELEVFVYGAQCVSFSGYCYWGYLANKGSGNRGSCSGPCRMFYRSKSSNITTPFYADYMDNLNYLTVLSNIGVDSIKIEGRLRKSEEISNQIVKIKNVLNGFKPIAPKYSPGFLSGKSTIRFKNYQSENLTIVNRANNELIITFLIQDNNCIVEISYIPYGILERYNLSDSKEKEYVSISRIYNQSCNICGKNHINFRVENSDLDSRVLINLAQFERFLKSVVKKIRDYRQFTFFKKEWISTSSCQIDNIDTFHYLYSKGFRTFIIDVNSENVLDYFLGLDILDITFIYKLPLFDFNGRLLDILQKLKNKNIMLAKISQLQLVEDCNWVKNKVYFDYTCNIFNRSTLQFLTSRGYTHFTASIEQNYDESFSVFNNHPTEVQYIVGGIIPVGVSVFPLDENITFTNLRDGYTVYVNYNSIWKTYSIYTNLLYISVNSDCIRNKRFIYSGMKSSEVQACIENSNQKFVTGLRLLYE